MKRFRLVEDVITNVLPDHDKIPLLSDGKTPNWKAIFDVIHPIDETAAPGTYEGATTDELWDYFYEDDNFSAATGITAVGAGAKIKSNFATTVPDELLSLGFNKASNKLLGFIEDTYIKSTGTYTELPKKWAAVHNSYRLHTLNRTDLTTSGAAPSTVVGKLIFNPSTWDTLSSMEIQELIKTIAEHNDFSPESIRDETYKNANNDAKVIATVITINLAASAAAPRGLTKHGIEILTSDTETATLKAAADTLLAKGKLLSWAEIKSNIEQVFGATERKDDAKTDSEIMTELQRLKAADITKTGRGDNDGALAIAFTMLLSADSGAHASETINFEGGSYAANVASAGNWLRTNATLYTKIIQEFKTRLTKNIPWSAFKTFCGTITIT